jgi:broad specificity phosphatase PhoE
MDIYFIRHGESSGNKEKKIQGSSESLTKKGKKQIKELKDKFDKIDLDLVFSSDLVRCLETTNILFKDKDIPIIYSSTLREKNNGDFEGGKIDEIDWTEVNSKPFVKRRIPNGETLLEVKKRADDFLYLLSKINLKKIAIVSHGTIMRMFLISILNKDIEDFLLKYKLKNGGISKIRYINNKFEVIYFEYENKVKIEFKAN